MNINLNNYEAFFLDYHEGKLSPSQVAELMSFLEEHPGLKEMFYEFENISLTELEDTDHNIEFEAKGILKKEVFITKDEVDDLLAGAAEGVLDGDQQKTLEEVLNTDPKIKRDLDLYRRTIVTADLSEVFEGKEELKRYVLIDNENYAGYLSAAIDNELNALEQKELDRFLLAHPSMQRELELFRKTKLVPDLRVIYENKDDLKRKKRGGMVWWYIPAAAAGIILIMGLFFLFSKPVEEGVVVVNNGTSGNVTNAAKSPVEEIKKSTAQAAETIAASDISSPGKAKAHKHNGNSSQSNEEEINVPMQDDLRDLQTPVVANNNIKEEQTPANDHIASNNNEINEQTDTEEYEGNLHPVASGYNSLRDVAIERLKTTIMKEEADVHAEPTKISKWDVLSLALRGFRKMTGKSTEMEKVYDEQGEVIAYNINLGGLEFSRNK